MEKHRNKAPRILIVYFSFSGQTTGLLNKLTAGLTEKGMYVFTERLRTVAQLRFPIGTVFRTLKMMFTTFMRQRLDIQKLSSQCFEQYDLIILAGPTWSYNPSGPVLSLLDQYGNTLFSGKLVLPLISCRGYWRMHWHGLRKKLLRCGAMVPNKIVFSHPNREPWRTLGVFLKLAGRNPERSPLWGKYYKKYGHSKKQLEEAYRFGSQLGEALAAGKELAALDFMTRRALP